MLFQIRAFIRANRGQSMIEFALIAPILILLLGGILDGGRVMYWQVVVTEAAREAAREVASSGDRTQAATAVAKFTGTFTTTVTPTPLVYATAVTVKVTTNVTIYNPVMSAFMTPNPFPVSATANMREESSSPIN